MALRRISDPADEPLTLAEAKLHLRVDGSEDDALITSLIKAAREQAGQKMGRTVMLSTWQLTLDEFPDAIDLPMPRVLSVLDVEYVDSAGAVQLLAPASYVLDNAGEIKNWLVPAAGYSWPDTYGEGINNVTVTYTAGWPNAAAVPESVKAWCKLAIGALYRQREGLGDGRMATLPRDFFDALLDPWRVPAI